jgi:hypothetical protein
MSRVMSAREKWKGYKNRIADDIISIISLDIFTPSIQLYGIEGCKTVAAINIIRNMKTFYLPQRYINLWQNFLRELSFELWENEWSGGGQAATYNLIEQASQEFYTNPKYLQFYPLQTTLHVYSNYPHIDQRLTNMSANNVFDLSDFM